MILEMKAHDGGIDAQNTEDSDGAVVRQIAEVTEKVITENHGPVDLVEFLEFAGRGLTPDLSELVGGDDGAIQNGIVPFSLEEQLEKDNSGDSDGAANVTAIHVLYENSIRESIEHLAETGQLKASDKLFRSIRAETDPCPRVLTAYTVFTYAKGWFAEQIVTNHERFAKLWITNDQMGQDMRDLRDNDEKQLKCVTYYAGNNTNDIKSSDIEHYFYQWTHDGLILGDADSANEVNGIAADRIGVGKTAYKKSYKGGPVNDIEGRSARVLW